VSRVSLNMLRTRGRRAETDLDGYVPDPRGWLARRGGEPGPPKCPENISPRKPNPLVSRAKLSVATRRFIA
jgi:hypothetical protein